MVYRDRKEAGRILGGKLKTILPPAGLLVLGIPRGGVVVAAAAAEELGAELDVVVVRKVGAPFNPELALGAVGPEGETVFNWDLMKKIGVEPEELEGEVTRQRQRVQELLRLFREGKPPLSLQGRHVVVVDDGIATGLTALAAARYVERHRPASLLVAAPVAAPETEEFLRKEGISTFFPLTPPDFWAVGQFYRDFRQVEDEEVCSLLAPRRPNQS